MDHSLDALESSISPSSIPSASPKIKDEVKQKKIPIIHTNDSLAESLLSMTERKNKQLENHKDIKIEPAVYDSSHNTSELNKDTVLQEVPPAVIYREEAKASFSNIKFHRLLLAKASGQPYSKHSLEHLPAAKATLLDSMSPTARRKLLSSYYHEPTLKYLSPFYESEWNQKGNFALKRVRAEVKFWLIIVDR